MAMTVKHELRRQNSRAMSKSEVSGQLASEFAGKPDAAKLDG